jgi:predicted lipoprotein with Yx(FWY)xxD motif/cytochrome c5
MRAFAVLAVAISVMSLALVSAKNEKQATVELAENAKYGQHLVDAEGSSLYVYLEDEQGGGTSACRDACLRNWPPLTVEGEPVAGEGVDAELLGTLSRENGSTQLTVNGWPVYEYLRDTEPGQARGAGLGNVFYLISPEGEPLTEELQAQAVEIDAELMAALMSEGQAAFANNCAACHGNAGQGAFGPRLAGNSNIANASFLVNRIITGFPEHGMPPFGHLSDRQIAAIATFVRNSWSNEFGAVTEEVVSTRRE